MTAVRNLQKMIHAGCRELGIDAETRHVMQIALTGKALMSEMDEAELRAVIEGLKARGFKPFGNSYFRGGKAGLKGRSKNTRKPAAPRADLRYCHVMWTRLGEAGALTKPGRDGLNAFIRSAFEGTWGSVPIDIDALRDARQIDDVVQALKAMCRRHGVKLK